MQIIEQSFHDSLVQQLKDQLTKEINIWFDNYLRKVDTLWNGTLIQTRWVRVEEPLIPYLIEMELDLHVFNQYGLDTIHTFSTLDLVTKIYCSTLMFNHIEDTLLQLWIEKINPIVTGLNYHQ